MSELIIIGIVAVALIGVLYIGISNQMVAKRNRVEKSESNIDVYLQERLDKMGALIEEFERTLDHEEKIQLGVAKYRANYHDAVGAGNVVDKDRIIGGMMRDFNATREAYPNLKGVDKVDFVMQETVNSEKKLVSARKVYNSNVNSYRNACEMFPTSIIANSKGYNREDYQLFEAEARAKGPRQSLYTNHYEDKYAVKDKAE